VAAVARTPSHREQRNPEEHRIRQAAEDSRKAEHSRLAGLRRLPEHGGREHREEGKRHRYSGVNLFVEGMMHLGWKAITPS